MIVEILKKADPVPVSSSLSSTSPDAKTSTPSVTAPPSTVKSASWPWPWPWRGRVTAAPDQAAALNALQQVAVKEGVPAKLTQYQQQLESVKAAELLQKAKDEVSERIAKLSDMGSFEQTLTDLKGRVKELADATSNEKKSVVDLIRKADLSNRQQGHTIGVQRSVIEALHSAGGSSSVLGGPADVSKHAAAKVMQKWYRATQSQQVMHEKAAQGHKIIQSKLDSSIRNIVEPNKNKVELNLVELNALAKKLDELATLEQAKKPELQKKFEQACVENDDKKALDLMNQVEACEKNIKGVEDQKKKSKRCYAQCALQKLTSK